MFGAPHVPWFTYCPSPVFFLLRRFAGVNREIQADVVSRVSLPISNALTAQEITVAAAADLQSVMQEITGRFQSVCLVAEVV
jgi:ABC-type molybdate transport system substrate-binding protein